MKSLLTSLVALSIAGAAMAQQQAAQGTGAILRVLEKVNGEVFDFELPNGTSYEAGRLVITLKECRFPVENPTGDAYAFVSVSEKGLNGPVFQGWMIASSPALNAMEHPRYDVWVLRCNTE